MPEGKGGDETRVSVHEYVYLAAKSVVTVNFAMKKSVAATFVPHASGFIGLRKL